MVLVSWSDLDPMNLQGNPSYRSNALFYRRSTWANRALSPEQILSHTRNKSVEFPTPDLCVRRPACQGLNGGWMICNCFFSFNCILLYSVLWGYLSQKANARWNDQISPCHFHLISNVRICSFVCSHLSRLLPTSCKRNSTPVQLCLPATIGRNGYSSHSSN